MKRTFIGIALIAALAVAGCGESTQAEKEAAEACPGISQAWEGKCQTKAAAERTKHVEAVEAEAHEVESVLKKREAEQTANALEGVER